MPSMGMALADHNFAPFSLPLALGGSDEMLGETRDGVRLRDGFGKERTDNVAGSGALQQAVDRGNIARRPYLRYRSRAVAADALLARAVVVVLCVVVLDRFVHPLLLEEPLMPNDRI